MAIFIHRRAATGLIASIGVTAILDEGALGEPQRFEISMTDEARFDPQTVTIRAGDTIRWTNPAIVSHSVTCDPAQAAKSADVSLPEGGAPFDSGEMQQGQTFLHQFTLKGNYQYFCKYHEGMGMTGTIVVT
jgi:plastocyanin